MNPWKGQGGGIYWNDKSKNWYHRPKINGNPTWRVLDVRTLTQARELKAKLDSDQTRAEAGIVKDPYAAPPVTIGELFKGYRADNCPMVDGIAREGVQLKYEQNRLTRLESFWDTQQVDKIKASDCNLYAAHRRKTIKRGNGGGRSIQMEIITLKAVLTWGLNNGKIDNIPLNQVPRFVDGKKVKHCRDFMPVDETELHTLARALFEDHASEALGWQFLFEAMTGCRTSEILRLRWDAADHKDAGFIAPGKLPTDPRHLFLNRSKKGVNPWALMHPALEATIEALGQWRVARGHTDCPWFFPSYRTQGGKKMPVNLTSLTHALARVAPLLVKHHITSHGLRAYFVAVRRSMGILDRDIAAEIGDKSGASIIESTYGAIRPGMPAIGWMVEKPAWDVLDLPRNVVQIASAVA